MGSIQHRGDRTKPWRARFNGPDGRQRSKSYERKVDAERWLRAERVPAPSVRPRRQLFLGAQEVTLLAEACEERQAGAGTLVRFLAYTGLRWGEAVALSRSDVNTSKRRVRVLGQPPRSPAGWVGYAKDPRDTNRPTACLPRRSTGGTHRRPHRRRSRVHCAQRGPAPKLQLSKGRLGEGLRGLRDARRTLGS